jgi:hypothetical protein
MTPLLNTIDPVLAHALAAFMAALLLIGALEKLGDMAVFTEALAQYQLVPASLIMPVAWLFPLMEALAGALLLPTVTRLEGALLAMVVVGTASLAIAINLRRGRTRIDCGCGMGEHTPLSSRLLWRNAVLLALLAACTLPLAQRSSSWLDLLAVAMSTLFLLGAYFLANTLLANEPRLAHLRSLL